MIVRFLHNARMFIEPEIDDYDFTPDITQFVQKDYKPDLILEYIDNIGDRTVNETDKDFFNDFRNFLETEYFDTSIWLASNIVTPIIIDKFINDISFYKDIFQFVNEDWCKLIYIVKLLSPNVSKTIDTNIKSLTILISHYDKMVEFYGKI